MKTKEQISPILLDVTEVSALLGVSARHVWRLADAGGMPKPVKLGRRCVWDRRLLENWIDAGCPSENRARKR
jgi:predicted DNA-binding transcriptional regulator AlpA